MPLDRLSSALRTVRRRVLAHRRLLAAASAGVAVVAGVQAATAPPPSEVPVVTAARDLPAGSVLAAEDLVETGFAPGTPPAGRPASAAALVGEVLAAPVRAGEPLTDVRLVGASLTDTDPGLVAVPVRLPDAATVALLEPGDRIDLVATDPEAPGSHVLLSDAPVLAVPPAPERTVATSQPGALVVLGVPEASVAEVADAGVRWFLSYAFSG